MYFVLTDNVLNIHEFDFKSDYPDINWEVECCIPVYCYVCHFRIKISSNFIRKIRKESR